MADSLLSDVERQVLSDRLSRYQTADGKAIDERIYTDIAHYAHHISLDKYALSCMFYRWTTEMNVKFDEDLFWELVGEAMGCAQEDQGRDRVRKGYRFVRWLTTNGLRDCYVACASHLRWTVLNRLDHSRLNDDGSLHALLKKAAQLRGTRVTLNYNTVMTLMDWSTNAADEMQHIGSTAVTCINNTTGIHPAVLPSASINNSRDHDDMMPFNTSKSPVVDGSTPVTMSVYVDDNDGEIIENDANIRIAINTVHWETRIIPDRDGISMREELWRNVCTQILFNRCQMDEIFVLEIQITDKIPTQERLDG